MKKILNFSISSVVSISVVDQNVHLQEAFHLDMRIGPGVRDIIILNVISICQYSCTSTLLCFTTEMENSLNWRKN